MSKCTFFKKIFFLFFIFVFPFFTHAASLSISPASKNVKDGDSFSVLVNVSSVDAINAATADMSFDNNILSVESVGYSNSIFSLWAEKPTYSNSTGKIHLSGGVPSPGWSGNSGSVVKVVFRAKNKGETKIDFENASVLANDGIGTNVLTSSGGASINISASAPAVQTQKSNTQTTSTSTITLSTSSVAPTSSTPFFTNVPDSLREGSVLSLDGVSISKAQLFVYVQKGNSNPQIIQVNSREDGEFNITLQELVVSGYYKVWARNIISDTTLATSSEPVYIEVLSSPSSIRFYGLNISYIHIILALAGIVMITFVFLVYFVFLCVRCRKKVTQKITKINVTK